MYLGWVYLSATVQKIRRSRTSDRAKVRREDDMVSSCKICGIRKSFKSADPAQCAWANLITSIPANRMRGFVGKSEMEELALLAAADEPCCNCNRSRLRWSYEEYLEKSCSHCLKRSSAEASRVPRQSEAKREKRKTMHRAWKSMTNLSLTVSRTPVR